MHPSFIDIATYELVAAWLWKEDAPVIVRHLQLIVTRSSILTNCFHCKELPGHGDDRGILQYLWEYHDNGDNISLKQFLDDFVDTDEWNVCSQKLRCCAKATWWAHTELPRWSGTVVHMATLKSAVQHWRSVLTTDDVNLCAQSQTKVSITASCTWCLLDYIVRLKYIDISTAYDHDYKSLSDRFRIVLLVLLLKSQQISPILTAVHRPTINDCIKYEPISYRESFLHKRCSYISVEVDLC